VTLKHCASSKAVSTSYSSKQAAATACNANTGCYGIYDSGCNDSGSWYQCKAESTWLTSRSSCVYKKTAGG
jgi:hypothetical protein